VTAAERAIVATFAWMTAGTAAAIPALVVPAPDDPLLTVTVQLVLLVGFSLALVFHLAPLGDRPWFGDLGLGPGGRQALTWGAIVVMVTGATGLVTLATSAGLRYDPSLQFLQMLSSLDIAWAAAALVLGLRGRFGARVGVVGGLLLGVVCVWAIWRYLDIVGFTADGGWLLRASELNRLVLPYDMGAAVLALIAFAAGVRAVRAPS
jgi:hypothetical protein